MTSRTWSQIADRLRASLPPEEYAAWISPLKVRSESADELVLEAPNAHFVHTVEENYRHLLDREAAAIRDELLQVLLATADGGAGPLGAVVEPAGAPALNPKYRFETFVVGSSNQFAHAAARAVAESPSRSYNPLFLYGPVGLGKTHLLHAIGHQIAAKHPRLALHYLTAEQFVNQLINSLRFKSMHAFRERFRSIDVLLVDDVQFLANKERTQEEFFHTFNALFEGKQQIILTCDRYPKEVDRLEPRLKSRLGWGLSVAIEPPDFETRAAILLAKAQGKGVDLPEAVAALIAKRLRSHVRDLEGALNTLIARANFVGKPITQEFAQETLRDLLTVHAQAISIPNIQKVVADYYQMRVADLLSKRRSRSIARPRQVAMTLAKELTEHSLPEIGDAFGGRDHTTVLHACRTVRDLRESDGKLRQDWDKLVRQLTG